MTSPEGVMVLAIITGNLIGIAKRNARLLPSAHPCRIRLAGWPRPGGRGRSHSLAAGLRRSDVRRITYSKIEMQSGSMSDTMVGKISRRTCREVLRCQPTRCAPQAWPGPSSSQVAYPQRKPRTGGHGGCDRAGPGPEDSGPAGRDPCPGVDDWDREDPGLGDGDPADRGPAGRDPYPGADDWDPDAGSPPTGAVFAQGRWGDELAPDPVLATLLDLAGREGLDSLDDDQLTGVLQAAGRLAAWAASLKLAATSGLAARREAAAARAGTGGHLTTSMTRSRSRSR